MENSHYEWMTMNQQAAAAAGGAETNNNVGNSRNNIDLTLKLGLPDFSHQNQALFDQLPAAPMAPNHLPDLITFTGPNAHHQGILNQLEMVNHQESMAPPVQQQSLNNGSTQYAWPPSNYQMASNNVQNLNHASAFNQFSVPSSMGFPSYSTNSYSNFTPTTHHHLQQLPAAAPSPAQPTNTYTLLDHVPPRRTTFELGSSSAGGVSGSGRRGGNRRQRVNYNDPNKRCTNYNCNTNNTPMWRRGPLGPKTLCNACGIKYRKEEEKRRPKES